METVCIKIGGSIIDKDGLLHELGSSLKNLIEKNIFPVIVHGGGKAIARNLNKFNKDFTFVEGHRATDKETLETVQMVLSGNVNKRIVNILLLCDIRAVGLSGVDCNLFVAEKLLVNGQDIGFVGKITNINTEIIEMYKKYMIVPIVSPVSRSKSGMILNVNADLAAGELAVATHADHLIFISDVDGVMIKGEVKQVIRTTEVDELITQEHITAGMVPKIRSAKEAVSKGVGKVHICSWYGKETLLNELGSETSRGTVIY